MMQARLAQLRCDGVSLIIPKHNLGVMCGSGGVYYLNFPCGAAPKDYTNLTQALTNMGCTGIPDSRNFRLEISQEDYFRSTKVQERLLDIFDSFPWQLHIMQKV